MTNKVYVGNISYSTSEESLTDLFSRYGTVEYATIIKDRKTGNSKGFGFVQFSSKKEAAKAVNDLHQRRFEGRSLQIVPCDYEQ